MNEEVAKPMIIEMKLLQELNDRFRKQYEQNLKDLTTLNAIIRLPRMADQFYKSAKRKEGDEVFQKFEKEAI